MKEFYLGGDYELSGSGALGASWGADEFIWGNFVQTGGTNSANWLGLYGKYTISGGILNIGYLYVDGGSFNITSSSASITIFEADETGLQFGSGCRFTAVPGATIHMTGSPFYNKSVDPSTLADLANLTLIFEGGSAVIDPFEVAGKDMGAVMDGFDLNFALGTLQLGGDDGIGQLLLIDAFDNQPAWEGCEALYVKNLVLGEGSSLDLNGLHLYYLTLSDLGGAVVLNGGALTQVPEPATLSLLVIGGCLLVSRRRLVVTQTRRHKTPLTTIATSP